MAILKEFVREHSERNRTGALSNVHSVTNSRGFVPSIDYFNKEVFSSNLKNYKVVHKGMLAYNPSRINVGSVALLDSADTVIVSPLYVVVEVIKDCLLPEYLNAFLHSPTALSQIKVLTSGSVRDSLRYSSFELLQLPVPHIKQQRVVVLALDKVFNLIAKCDEQIVRLDKLVKSRFVEMFGDPMTNPKGWPTGRVSDLAKYWNGLTYKPENVSDTGTIVLRSSNIQGGSLDFADIVRVNISAKEKNLVAPGDVLMCSRNGSAALVGKTAIIPKTDERMYFGAFMMILRSEVPEYLNAFFATKAFRSQITCGATSTVNQITCTMMDNVSLPLPPKDLMREFAAFVEKVDKLAFAARRRRDVAKQLYRAKIQEYFG